MNSSHYFGVSVVSAGTVNPPDVTYEQISNKSGRSYKKVIIKDGKVVGMVFSGDIEKSGIVYNLIKNKVDVTAFKQDLVADYFGLLSLPEEMWRSSLELPPKPEPVIVQRSGGH